MNVKKTKQVTERRASARHKTDYAALARVLLDRLLAPSELDQMVSRARERLNERIESQIAEVLPAAMSGNKKCALRLWELVKIHSKNNGLWAPDLVTALRNNWKHVNRGACGHKTPRGGGKARKTKAPR